MITTNDPDSHNTQRSSAFGTSMWQVQQLCCFHFWNSAHTMQQYKISCSKAARKTGQATSNARQSPHCVWCDCGADSFCALVAGIVESAADARQRVSFAGEMVEDRLRAGAYGTKGCLHGQSISDSVIVHSLLQPGHRAPPPLPPQLSSLHSSDV